MKDDELAFSAEREVNDLKWGLGFVLAFGILLGMTPFAVMRMTPGWPLFDRVMLVAVAAAWTVVLMRRSYRSLARLSRIIDWLWTVSPRDDSDDTAGTCR